MRWLKRVWSFVLNLPAKMRTVADELNENQDGKIDVLQDLEDVVKEVKR